jgi:hypothetical protein
LIGLSRPLPVPVGEGSYPLRQVSGPRRCTRKRWAAVGVVMIRWRSLPRWTAPARAPAGLVAVVLVDRQVPRRPRARRRVRGRHRPQRPEDHRLGLVRRVLPLVGERWPLPVRLASG